MNVVVVQARTGSSRLPGKVTMDLLGVPVLARVWARPPPIPRVDTVCCAIPDLPQDDALADLARSLGAEVVRGPETDVLTRYLLAARATNADTVMRVTSDCPVLDPGVSGRVLATQLTSGADYTSNVDPRSWPKGLDTEAFSRAALERTAAEATDPYDREHVTPYMRRAAEFKRENVALPSDEHADWRWTLDYAEDLAFFRQVLALLPPWPHLPGFDEIRRLIETRPDLARINAHLV